MPRARVLALDPAAYRPHPLHGGLRDWVESNCYLDLWIELLHALELEVHACLGFTLASDFEGDQWTFAKPGNFDLVELYGISIEELTLWRSLAEHCLVQLIHGHLPLLEVDAFHLPDVAQTDYRTNHVKTTIGVCAIDTDARWLEYFHNAGYYRLEGDDYAGLLRIDRAHERIELPPYCEIVKLQRRFRLADDRLRRVALRQSALHFARGPADNPVNRFARTFDAQLARVVAEGEPGYHPYVFAGLRQMGAAAEYAALHLRWLADAGEAPLLRAADALGEVSATARVLLLKTARMVARGGVSDVSGQLAQLRDAWQRAHDALQQALGA